MHLYEKTWQQNHFVHTKLAKHHEKLNIAVTTNKFL
jgi:hypothetical protein